MIAEIPKVTNEDRGRMVAMLQKTIARVEAGELDAVLVVEVPKDIESQPVELLDEPGFSYTEIVGHLEQLKMRQIIKSFGIAQHDT